jgi:hypothetical protein
MAVEEIIYPRFRKWRFRVGWENCGGAWVLELEGLWKWASILGHGDLEV